jgi:hypothetical protein
MNAVINGDRIECWKCRAMLGRIVHDHICIGSPDAACSGNGKALEIMCKYKDKIKTSGKHCNTINRIAI